MRLKHIVLLLLLVSFASAQSTTLKLTTNLQSHIPQGPYDVQVQVLDDSGHLTDIDSLSCEIKEPLGGESTIVLKRASMGTFTATFPFTDPKQYYLLFVANKQGFSFTNIEYTIYVDPPSYTDLTVYIFPVAIAIATLGVGYLALTWRR
jgi:hypothetical protein